MFHEFSSHSNRPWECRHCKSEEHEPWHAEGYEADSCECQFCGRAFPTFDGMVAHEAREH